MCNMQRPFVIALFNLKDDTSIMYVYINVYSRVHVRVKQTEPMVIWKISPETI